MRIDICTINWLYVQIINISLLLSSQIHVLVFSIEIFSIFQLKGQTVIFFQALFFTLSPIN